MTGKEKGMELVLKNLTKVYGRNLALDHVNVTFHEGVCGILGTNGAGKSTLMNLITDTIARTDGKILFNGKDTLKLGRAFRKIVGYMPQMQGYYPTFSGRNFLGYMADIKEIPRREAQSQIEQLLKLVNLEDVAYRKVNSYSGGMKQRLLLAQALLGDPLILLLDEPTAGLDPKERIRIRNYIHTLAANRIVLLTTHIVSDVETIADTILLMKNGRIAEYNTIPELIKKMRDASLQCPVSPTLEDIYLYYLDAQEEAV